MNRKQQISPSGTYLRCSDGEYSYKNVPFEEFNWTGRWQIIKKDKKCYLYLERRMMLFGVIPTFKIWESQNQFRYENYETYTNECDINEVLL